MGPSPPPPLTHTPDQAARVDFIFLKLPNRIAVFIGLVSRKRVSRGKSSSNVQFCSPKQQYGSFPLA